MTIIRRIISLILLVVATVVLVGVCMRYNWNDFVDAFEPFSFNLFVDELLAFFAKASNAIVLVMIGFLGLTLPGRAK
ncbi:MAG: hypothetical protein MJ054_00850 [Clostridia bacterium]|nr:hypothetical protein [Clostridia bacterium]